MNSTLTPPNIFSRLDPQFLLDQVPSELKRNDSLVIESTDSVVKRKWTASVAFAIAALISLGHVADAKSEQHQDAIVPLLESAASDNHAQAIRALAKCHYRGVLGKQKDDIKSKELLEQAARLGDSDSKVALALYYKYGIGTAVDHTHACKLLEEEVANRNSEAMIYLGNYCMTDKYFAPDRSRGYRLFLCAEQLGNVEAKSKLGRCFLHGHGVEKDVKKAIKFFEEGVKLQDRESMFYLALCYIKRAGVPPNIEKAIGLLQTAVDLGHKKAIPFLASSYEFRGRRNGDSQDLSLALKYYRRGTSKAQEGAKRVAAALNLN